LMHLFVYHKKHLDFLHCVIDREVAQCKEENTLFRGNSLAIACFQIVAKIAGTRYLWNTLGVFITELAQKSKVGAEKKDKQDSLAHASSKTSLFDEELEMEVDPSKVEEGEDLGSSSINKYTLLLITQKLFHTILLSKDMIPYEIRSVLEHVKESVGHVFQSAQYKAIGAFFFLRLVVPAITTPHTYGLLPSPADSVLQRNLVLLGKILQNLANGVEFGKEEHMKKLNDFIDENVDNLHKFFDEISTKGTGDPTQQQHNVPDNCRLNAIIFLHSFITWNKSTIISDLSSTQEFVKKLNTILSELGEPPAKKK